MRVYCCTWLFEAPQKQALDNTSKRDRLISYYHSRDKKSLVVLEGVMKTGQDLSLFLDSGAFSAFTQKVEINLDEYCQFIQQWKDVLDVYAVLDVIGSASKTWDNQVEMERQGLSPLPTFHYGEDASWLKRYMDKYSYIAIGGMVPIPNAKLLPWLDMLFSKYLTDSKGKPRVKLHGFGMTSIPLMRRYPWYSVDSTSWILCSRFGFILIPGEDGKDLKVCVSEKAGKSNLEKDGRHFKTLSKLEQKVVEKYLAGLGYSLEDVAGDYKKRDEVNILFFRNLEDTWVPRPLGEVQPSFM